MKPETGSLVIAVQRFRRMTKEFLYEERITVLKQMVVAASQRTCSEPGYISAPATSLSHALTSRRLNPNRPDSIVAVARIRGPKAPFKDPGSPPGFRRTTAAIDSFRLS